MALAGRAQGTGLLGLPMSAFQTSKRGGEREREQLILSTTLERVSWMIATRATRGGLTGKDVGEQWKRGRKYCAPALTCRQVLYTRSCTLHREMHPVSDSASFSPPSKWLDSRQVCPKCLTFQCQSVGAISFAAGRSAGARPSFLLLQSVAIAVLNCTCLKVSVIKKKDAPSPDPGRAVTPALVASGLPPGLSPSGDHCTGRF